MQKFLLSSLFIFTVFCVSQPKEWKNDAILSDRTGHTATLLQNDLILVVGGVTGAYKDQQIIDEVVIYQPTIGIIGRILLNIPRYEHTATLLADGSVLIAGGIIDTNTYEATNTIEIFDPKTNTVTLQLTTLSSKRAFHCATAIDDGRIVFTGGRSGNENIDVYNIATQEVLSSPSWHISHRRSHTSTHIGENKILLFGGKEQTEGTLSEMATIYQVHPDGKLGFVRSFPMAAPRYDHTATLLENGDIVFFGGREAYNDYIVKSIEHYDHSENVLKSFSISVKYQGRIDHCAVAVGLKVIVIGGSNYTSNIPTFSRVESYFFGNLRGFPSLVTRRSGAVALVRKHVIYVIGGTSSREPVEYVESNEIIY